MFRMPALPIIELAVANSRTCNLAIDCRRSSEVEFRLNITAGGGTGGRPDTLPSAAACTSRPRFQTPKQGSTFSHARPESGAQRVSFILFELVADEWAIALPLAPMLPCEVIIPNSALHRRAGVNSSPARPRFSLFCLLFLPPTAARHFFGWGPTMLPLIC